MSYHIRVSSQHLTYRRGAQVKRRVSGVINHRLRHLGFARVRDVDDLQDVRKLLNKTLGRLPTTSRGG